MGLFDKLKNVLFEDDEETEELPVIEKKEVNTSAKEDAISQPRFKSADLKDGNNLGKVENNNSSSLDSTNLSEKNEKPIFQSFDEEEFDRIAAINRNRLLERDRKAREKKELERKLEEQQTRNNNYDIDINESRSLRKDVKTESRTTYINRSTPSSSREEIPTRRFKPSPVISPVYGILDKNYRKEDILPRASSDGTLPKVMDVDNVRRKAFGILEEEIAKNDPLKNFQSEKKEEPVTSSLIGKNIEDVVSDTENYRDVEKIEDPVISFEDDINDFKIEESKDKTKVDEDTLESDLFNLIDSMYENREDK